MGRLAVGLAAVGAVLMLVAAGCGDDGGSESGGEPEFDIETITSRFPAYGPDQWEVPVGEVVRLTYTNEGAGKHDWTLLSEAIESKAEFDDGLVIAQVTPENLGGQDTITFTLDEPGTYQVICTIAGHFDVGMEGTLIAG
jgi:plastocyanin